MFIGVYMKKTIIFLAKTKIGNLNRTTVPERVREILGVSEGDEIIWIQKENKIYVENARKEEEE